MGSGWAGHLSRRFGLNMAGAVEREMRLFTRGLFQQSPDLSVLSQSLVRSRFLAHSGRSVLTSQERTTLKKIVEEELLRMQVTPSRK
ncbi:hypothetical protein GDO81_025691 [Engystomops pustulosus]|uniref:Uncharacterized protein n=1 Tax=Engystomops pustulosus TaxID=76066 RepID=A0AAV6Z3N2_ENGPU|nr:hypothetical protein GDO81_025691 [Engystomops pustulosus]